jgi:hypothetical protein
MMESAKENIATEDQKPLVQEIIQLSDDFGEFAHVSSFLCHALANALAEHEWLDQDIIAGGRLCSNWLQKRTSQLRDEMRHVQERYIDENQNAADPTHSAQE